MKTKLKFLSIIAAVFAAFYIFGRTGYVLTDLVTGTPAADFSVTWPSWRVFVEPFTAFANYLQSGVDYPAMYLSWMAWLALITVLVGIRAKKTTTALLKNICTVFLVFYSVVAVLLLSALPSPYLVVPSGWVKANFHSHTYSSLDAICSVEENISFHRKLGFDASFITEHNDYHESYLNAYQGMQLNTENISLLVLDRGRALLNYSPYGLLKKTIPEAVRNAHKQGFMVLCPHWWKWGKPSWDELNKAGVDGFEIYNVNYRNFNPDERRRLIEFCLKHKLMMIGNTDWKGFGRYNDVWTVFKIGKMPEDLRQLAQVQSKVIVYEKPEYRGGLRVYFEPIIGVYCMLNGLTLTQVVSWLLWIFTFLIMLSYKHWKTLLSFSALVFLLWQLTKYGLLLASLGGNDALSKLLIPFLCILSVGWLAINISLLRKQRKNS